MGLFSVQQMDIKDSIFMGAYWAPFFVINLFLIKHEITMKKNITTEFIKKFSFNETRCPNNNV